VKERDPKKLAGALLGVCVVLVLGLALLQMWRTSELRQAGGGPIPRESLEIPATPPQCADKRCVARLARAFADKTRAAGRADDAQKLLGAAEALERGDCDSAIETRNAMNRSVAPDLVDDDLTFTMELMKVCLFSEDLFGIGDGGLPLEFADAAPRAPRDAAAAH
jgi:hypothetical protein